jgi:energy-coupling factor transporter ATP-binding protein EcfA2
MCSVSDGAAGAFVHPGIHYLCPAKPAADAVVAAAWQASPVDFLIEALGKVHVVSPDGPLVYCDADRLALVRDLGSVLDDLNSCRLVGNAHARMVTGPKGTGKSTLLQALVAAVQAVAANTLAVYVNVQHHWSGTPSCVLAEAWEKTFGSPLVAEGDKRDLDAVLRALRAKGHRALLVADEYHTLYCLQSADADPWLSQTNTLVNSTSGTVAVVVAGSCAYLHDLCFGHHRLDPRYPAYRGKMLSLNRERTQVRMVGPIQTRRELREFLMGYQPPPPPELLCDGNNPELDAFFLATGGVRRTIDRHLQHIDAGSATSDEVGPAYKLNECFRAYHGLWLLLLECLDALLLKCGDADRQSVWHQLRWIHYADLQERLDAIRAMGERTSSALTKLSNSDVEDVDLSSAALHSASEAGAIVYKETTSTRVVRFSMPMQPLFVRQRRFADAPP